MKLTIYDMVILQDYFAKKQNQSKEDKDRAKMLNDELARLVDGLKFYTININEDKKED